MPFTLGDINGWKAGLSCTPTALSALSGKAPEEVAVLLQQEAKKHGREIGPELRNDYDVNDWLEVVNALGGNWAPGEDYSQTPFEQRLTIDKWMANHLGVEPELVFCDDNGNIGHVFATVDGDVVDTYTCGKRMPFTQVPESFRFLRVKRTFLVD